MTSNLQNRIKEIQSIAADLGFDYFPINFEVVSENIMNEIVSYGLPTRMRHWSFGVSYEQQKLYGQMGLSRVYEIILNNDPAHAFLLDSNRDIDNIMVAAHVVGHSHYFKHNATFQGTDRNMVHHAAERAMRVESYIDEFGIDKVERLMDAGFALSHQIDWNRGIFRQKYKPIKASKKVVREDEFADLLGSMNKESKTEKTNYDFPPSPEKDLLWFLINYAQLEEWEKDILSIIREESYYFYPQYQTKISNEGFAVFAHTEIMRHLNITPEEMLNYASLHEKVCQKGHNQLSINPYYLGFKIFKDIEKRLGRDKIFEAVKMEDDISFLRNYLTKDLVKELGLFNFGYKCQEKHDDGKKCPKCLMVEVKSKDVEHIINNLIKPMLNYGVPNLTITRINGDLMIMKHKTKDFGPLDFKYAEKTMELMYYLWKSPIEIESVDDDSKPVVLTYDSDGFSVIN